jgi:predicted CXXCH cytochrome family protein
MDQGRWSVVITATLGLAIMILAWAVAYSQPARKDPNNSLPSTNFSADGSVDRSSLPRPAPGFAHARVATNPQAPDARAVGEKTCIACHQLEAEHFTHTLHSLGLHVANRSDPTIPVCEACHGPGSEHAAKPLLKGLIIGYTKNSGTPIETQTNTCLTCHAGGPRDHWLGSVHQRNDLSCSDCHNPMAKFSVEGLMAKSSVNDTCAQCHKDIRLQFNRRSHMPLPEGQMSCDDCHNPHGTLTSPLLKTN